MNKFKKGIAFLLLFVLSLQGIVLNTQAANRQYRMNIEIVVDGREMGLIPAVDDSYENNRYISIKGLACALQGTEKAFTPEIEKRKISIATESGDCQPVPVWDEEELEEVGTASAVPYELYVNESERKYYSFIVLRGEEDYDAFMTPISLAMLLDLDIEVVNDRVEIDTSRPYAVSAREMEESGYLQGVNALAVGDGSTGEMFYLYQEDQAVPIASTTKLMTYLVFMDAVSRGDCSLEDTVVISEKAERLSNGADGVLPMTAGSMIPVTELLYGMLLPSSNECALALAEHAAGSEEAFVEQMNEKAQELGWEKTEFYNCHGLPCYEEQLIPAKMQNHMTAAEMFGLASVIMDTYPQITEFTAVKEYHSEVFGQDIKNTNAVLYNVDNTVGLKTGTTNKAGACLVTCVAAVKDGETHHLITVLFGAEGNASRGTVSEMAARYALAVLQDKEAGYQSDSAEEEGIPTDPEKVVRKLLKL